MHTVTAEVFNELKDAAIKIWQTYDNTYGYADAKIEQVNAVTNFKDNYGTFIGMFDIHNQRKLYDAVGPEARELIDDWVGGSLTGAEQRMVEKGLF